MPGPCDTSVCEGSNEKYLGYGLWPHLLKAKVSVPTKEPKVTRGLLEMRFSINPLEMSLGRITIITAICGFATYFAFKAWQARNRIVPISVNYHFTRKCNKVCRFCFHTEKTSHVASESDMKRGLRLLKAAGMRKINFAGGEPFLYPKTLGMLCWYCKDELKLQSVSIISNGTLTNKSWLEEYGRYVDVLGVSCDSFDEATNEAIGRGTGNNVKKLFEIRDWCRELGIKFKLNTVVCTLNWHEDMADTVEQLDPFRWKVFQVLAVGGENDATENETEHDKRKRDARKLLISREQFGDYCARHRHLKCFVPEPNQLMASSYLIVDEYLCFLDKGGEVEKQSASILLSAWRRH